MKFELKKVKINTRLLFSVFAIGVLGIILLSISRAAPPSTGYWEIVHPGAGGQVQQIIPDPNIPGRLYRFSDVEGGYRSDDFGENWSYIAYEFKQSASFTAAIEPGNSNRVYVGTADGVHISNNAGKNWTVPNSLKNIPSANIEIDPNNINNVYVGPSWHRKSNILSNVGTPTNGPRTIWFSRNRGSTWTESEYQSGDGLKQVYQTAIDGNNIYIAAAAGLYKGVWNGSNNFNWTKITLPAGKKASRGVVLSPNGNTIYAVFSDSEQVSPRDDADGATLYAAKTSNLNSWQSISNALPPAQFWRPKIDPRSSPAQHKILLGALGKGTRYALNEATINISNDLPSNVSWARKFSDDTVVSGDTNSIAKKYDLGWETRASQVDHYNYVPTSWDVSYPGRWAVFSQVETEYSVNLDNINQNKNMSSKIVGSVGNLTTYQNRGIAATVNTDMATNKNYVVQTGADIGFIESWDGGIGWAKSEDLHKQPDGGLLLSQGDSAAVAETSTPIVLLGMTTGFGGGDNGNGYLYAKKLNNYDERDNWKYIAGSGKGKSAKGGLGERRIYAIDSAPTNQNNVVLATEKGLFESSNISNLYSGSGGNFASIGFDTQWVSDVKFDANNNNILYVAANQGTYKGTRSGSNWSWTQINSIKRQEIDTWKNGSDSYAVSDAGSTVILSKNGGPFTTVMTESVWANLRSHSWDQYQSTGSITAVAGGKNYIFVIGSDGVSRKGHAVARGTIASNGSVSWEDWTGDYVYDTHLGSRSGYLLNPRSDRMKVEQTNGVTYLYVVGRGTGMQRRPINAEQGDIVVDTTKPTVNITSPSANSTINGTTTLQSTASDDVAVKKVEFYIGTESIGLDLTSPYSTSLDTTKFNNGTYTIKAVAEDSSGNTKTISFDVIIQNLSQPLIGVSITSPSNAAVLSANSTVNITASGDNSISNVNFYLGQQLLGSDNTSPYSFVLDSTQFSNGDYQLKAVATDISGLKAEDSISVSILNQEPDTAYENVFDIGEIENTIIVDGVLEKEWIRSNIYDAYKDIQVGSDTPLASDLSASFRMMHDGTNLYLAVFVTDDVIIGDSLTKYHKDDSIELYFDGNNDKTIDPSDLFQFQYRIADRGFKELKQSATSGAQSAVSFHDGGYTVEMMIPWNLIGVSNPSSSSLGFEIQVNDDDDGGERDSKIGWYANYDTAYEDPSALGSLGVNSDALPTVSDLGIKFRRADDSSLITTPSYLDRSTSINILMDSINSSGYIYFVDSEEEMLSNQKLMLNKPNGTYNVDVYDRQGIPIDQIDVRLAHPDYDRDGVIDINDLTKVISNWNQTGPGGPTKEEIDLDADGIIGINDLTVLIGAWTTR